MIHPPRQAILQRGQGPFLLSQRGEKRQKKVWSCCSEGTNHTQSQKGGADPMNAPMVDESSELAG
jgi:hypothetical protein